MDIIKQLSDELKIREDYAKNIVNLIDDGNTIPFIARYRKEMTGSMDDQLLREFFDRLNYLRGLEKRKEEVISAIEGLEKLTPELQQQILDAKTLAVVEDLYRPYKQKKKTRASIAKERGLEPLSEFIGSTKVQGNNIIDEAEKYINEENKILTADDAINGALDIIAETISDNAEIRAELRELFLKKGVITSKKADDEENSVYAMYADYSESVAKIPGHRILAIDRGENEKALKIGIEVEEELTHNIIYRNAVKLGFVSSEYVKNACDDSYSRLIEPSIEREIRNTLSDNAAEQAIKVFAVNLKNLLMQHPVKNKVTLGLDPAYRTGCKIAVVDGTGKVLTTTVIYPTPPQSKIKEAEETLLKLIDKYHVDVISIGNGTASKESEMFVADLIKKVKHPVSYMVVSEAGASVYSASKLAAEEFPEYDVSLRSAVSIARRLQDPLSELVKIDPKAVGVGQYQHDMPPKKLDEALDGVVEDCVNSVGVDLNTASHSLLSHIAGINAGIAKNIVSYREENGEFDERKELLKVPKLGKKAYEQCAGFLRVSEGKNILDNTAVHPESYKVSQGLLKALGYTLSDVKEDKISDLEEKAESYGLSKLAQELDAGVPTIKDIISELLKPGRDPRDELPKPLLRTDVMDLKDLKPDMEFTGTVRNVIDFGAFIDIGVHEDGLVHISQICDRYIKHPSEVLKVGDIVKVKILEVDLQRKRIALTMKGI